MAKKILVVDDNEAVRESLVFLLDHYGYEVSIVEDGEEAIDAIDSTMPDLVISDVEMPKKSGREVLLHVRDNRLPIKVIMMSAGEKDELEKEFMSFGADAFFEKITDTKVKIDKIKEVLGE